MEPIFNENFAIKKEVCGFREQCMKPTDKRKRWKRYPNSTLEKIQLELEIIILFCTLHVSNFM